MVLLGPCTVWALNFSDPFVWFMTKYSLVIVGARAYSLQLFQIHLHSVGALMISQISQICLYEDSFITLFSGNIIKCTVVICYLCTSLKWMTFLL